MRRWGAGNSIGAPPSPGFQVPFEEVTGIVLVQTRLWVGFERCLFESGFHRRIKRFWVMGKKIAALDEPLLHIRLEV